ncbi:MAG TPA: hypothetical protein VLF67_00135 [Candidatus Saccharimonas sp.]|nr:hypothetical protein [Candidatus Saccharimonas sp.]
MPNSVTLLRPVDSPAVVGWTELFPSYQEPSQLDLRLLQLASLTHQLGLPFPAEPKRPYSIWWHALHEVAHWAVKPDWYIDYSLWLRPDIRVRTGHLVLPAGLVPGFAGLDIADYRYYAAGNDLIPDIYLPSDDPTPSETEVRRWSLQMLDWFGWPHPLRENVNADGSLIITHGDLAFYKPASGRVWHPRYLTDPAATAKMAAWGIDVPAGQLRPVSDPFALPYPRPSHVSQVLANMDVIYRRYGSGQHQPIPPDHSEYWLTLVAATLQH